MECIKTENFLLFLMYHTYRCTQTNY